MFGGQFPNFNQQEEVEETPTEEIKTKREDIKKQLLNGELEEEIVKIKVEQEQQTLGMMGMENNPQMQDMLSQMMPKKKLKETCQLSQREKF